MLKFEQSLIMCGVTAAIGGMLEVRKREPCEVERERGISHTEQRTHCLVDFFLFCALLLGL